MHYPGASKRWHSKNSLGRGYGSRAQNNYAKKKTLWATKNKDKLMTADELYKYINKRGSAE